MKLLVVLALLFASTARADDIKVETLAEQPVVITTVRAKPAELSAALQRAYFSIFSAAKDLDVAGPPFARYVSRGDVFVVEAGVPVKTKPASLPGSLKAGSLPAGAAAVYVHKGPHEKLVAAHAKLDAWLAKSKRKPSGARWEIFLTTPLTVSDPAKHETKVVVPLEK